MKRTQRQQIENGEGNSRPLDPVMPVFGAIAQQGWVEEWLMVVFCNPEATQLPSTRVSLLAFSLLRVNLLLLLLLHKMQRIREGELLLPLLLCASAETRINNFCCANHD